MMKRDEKQFTARHTKPQITYCTRACAQCSGLSKSFEGLIIDSETHVFILVP